MKNGRPDTTHNNQYADCIILRRGLGMFVRKQSEHVIDLCGCTWLHKSKIGQSCDLHDFAFPKRHTSNLIDFVTSRRSNNTLQFCSQHSTYLASALDTFIYNGIIFRHSYSSLSLIDNCVNMSAETECERMSNVMTQGWNHLKTHTK